MSLKAKLSVHTLMTERTLIRLIVLLVSGHFSFNILLLLAKFGLFCKGDEDRERRTEIILNSNLGSR